MQRSSLVALFVVLGLSAITHASVLDGIDSYGSREVAIEAIVAHAGHEIDEYAAARIAENPAMAAEAEVRAIKKIAELGNFAFIRLSLIRYPPPKAGRYLTVDLVDQADAPTRLSFLPSPKGSFADASNLLAEWDKYQTQAFELEMAGEISYPLQCPAFHCTAGFDHPKLKHFGELFSSKAPVYAEELFRIFHEDKDDHKRANAAFLLAHTGDGYRLVQELSLRIRDSSAEVRNNIMRVLANIGFSHPGINLPTGKMIEALSFPTTTDRNKALAVLSSIAKREDSKRVIIESAGQKLIEILKLQQPNNHDWAYVTLVNLSGQTFSERDYAAWSNWLSTQIKE